MDAICIALVTASGVNASGKWTPFSKSNNTIFGSWYIRYWWRDMVTTAGKDQLPSPYNENSYFRILKIFKITHFKIPTNFKNKLQRAIASDLSW